MTNEELLYTLTHSNEPESLLVAYDLAIELNCGLFSNHLLYESVLFGYFNPVLNRFNKWQVATTGKMSTVRCSIRGKMMDEHYHLLRLRPNHSIVGIENRVCSTTIGTDYRFPGA